MKVHRNSKVFTLLVKKTKQNKKNPKNQKTQQQTAVRLGDEDYCFEFPGLIG